MNRFRDAGTRFYEGVDRVMQNAKKPRERREKPSSRARYILKGARAIGLMGLAFYAIDRGVSNLDIELIPALLSTITGATVGAGLGDLVYRRLPQQDKSQK